MNSLILFRVLWIHIPILKSRGHALKSIFSLVLCIFTNYNFRQYSESHIFPHLSMFRRIRLRSVIGRSFRQFGIYKVKLYVLSYTENQYGSFMNELWLVVYPFVSWHFRFAKLRTSILVWSISQESIEASSKSLPTFATSTFELLYFLYPAQNTRFSKDS